MKSTLKLQLIPTLASFFAATLCAGMGASFSTNTIADAFVAAGPNGSLSGNNFGAAGALAVAAGGLPQGEFQSVLRFDLSGARNSFDAQFGAGLWSVQSVTLRLTSSPHNNPIFNDIAPGQFSVSLLQNNSWVEGTGTGGIPTTDGISFNSLLNTLVNNGTDQALGSFSFGGGSSGQNTYSLGLASGLTAKLLAGDNLSLRLFAADDAVSYLFSSRSTGSAGPQLNITVVPEPSTLALGLAGLAGLWVWRRARSRG